MPEKKSSRKKLVGRRKRKGATKNIGTIKDFFILKLKSIEKESLPQTHGVKRKAGVDTENDDGNDALEDAEGERGSTDLSSEHVLRGAQSVSKKIRGETTDSSQWAWFMGDGLRKGMEVRKPHGNKKEGGMIYLGN